MKKILLLSMILINSVLCFSQDYGTTLEEYNYITKGYATQIEQGLDMKIGYKLVSIRPGYGADSKTVVNLSDGSSIEVELELLVNESKDLYERAVMLIITNKPYELKRYLCVPNGYSSEIIWGKYWDEIKFMDSNELLAITYAMSKSKSIEMTCFPENATVKMASGREKPIHEIAKGDTVISYSFERNCLEFAVVEDLQVHSNNSFVISKVNMTLSDNRTAALENTLSHFFTIEATNNHPIKTDNGVKEFGDLNINDKVYCFSEEIQDLVLCDILSIETNARKVIKVYNLKLQSSNNFIVNGTLVLTK